MKQANSSRVILMRKLYWMALWITGNHFSDHSRNMCGILYTIMVAMKRLCSFGFKSSGSVDKSFLLFLCMLRFLISVVLPMWFFQSAICSFVLWKVSECAYGWWSLVGDNWMIAKISNMTQNSVFFFSMLQSLQGKLLALYVAQ